MKKIMFFLPNLNQGGAEKVIVTLANELNREKFKIIIVLFKKEGHFLNLLKKDVQIIELKTNKIRFSIFKIIPLIRKQKPDIAFFGWGEIAAFISPFIPCFTNIHFIARETNVVSKHVTRKEIRFFYRFYNNFHKIIAQSNDMKYDLIENWKVKSQKIYKINNPIDVEYIQNQMISDEKLFSDEYKNVLAIGNLSQRKGFDLLLNVFSHLKDEKIKLIVLGDGSDKEKLIQQKKELDLENVEFIGIKKNPYPYLFQADLFVLSSRYEGFPNVLLEAGVCGIYSLANNCPGGIDEIIEEGVNGEVFSILNSKLFAERIKVLLSEKYNRKTIQNSIIRRFSKEIIINQYEKVLSQI